MHNATPEAKEAMVNLISEHGAVEAIMALASALHDLGPEWQGNGGAAMGIECVTGYAPHAIGDWRIDRKKSPPLARGPIVCFLSLRITRSRTATYPVPSRYRAELIARGTGSVVYRSKGCDTKEQADSLARRFLNKHPNVVLG